jgi:hypothetical protein
MGITGIKRFFGGKILTFNSPLYGISLGDVHKTLVSFGILTSGIPIG